MEKKIAILESLRNAHHKDVFRSRFKLENLVEEKNRTIQTLDKLTMDEKFYKDHLQYDKEGIKLEIQDGYLTVHASVNKEENDEEKGRFVRKERYSGACSRSFYVGENITEDEIKAKFKNGTLTIIVPKKEDKKELPSKKYIEIE